MSALPLVGALEAGGGKFVSAVGRGPAAELLAREKFATGDDPRALLAKVAQWLGSQQSRHGPLHAIGIATFGPVDLRPRSPTYGQLTTTPKPGWAHADMLGALRSTFPDVPLVLDTDVNGAALGEHVWGAARGMDDFVYITIGTGIGGGAMVGGLLVHGLLHPEMGHVRIPRISGDDAPGACIYHGDCWEGLCSGLAIKVRTGMPAEELPADHPAWQVVTSYIGSALANIVCVLSPQRIILGGGVRKGGQLGQEAFFRLVRSGLRDALKDYVAAPELSAAGIDEFVVPPLLGDDAGICGAIALAQRAVQSRASAE